MPHQAELPEETFAGRASPANDPTVPTADIPPAVLDFEDDTGSARTPMRFGRLALWMASASALGIGVLGTVAYSMWFTHDQRVYAEAMTSARRTLGIEQPALVAGQTQSAGVVEPALPQSTYGAAPIDTAPLADNAPTTDAASSDGSDVAGTAGLAAVTAAAAASTQGGDGSQGTANQAAAARKPGASSRSNRQAYQVAQVPRRHEQHSKAEPGLFARMGAFFHRVSYQRNVPSRQREEYSRP